MPRLLGEFLHEQQEPFALDAYLIERGYSASTISRRNRARFLVGSLSCTEFAKAVFCRVISHNSHSNVKRKIKNPDKPEEINNSNEQLSPVSILEEETESDTDDEENHHKFNKKTQGESTNIHRRVREFQEVDPYDQYIINKKILRQTKQLLIDCVREVLEQYRKRDNDGSGLKKILGTDELWKLVCENVWLWSLDSIHETNVMPMLRHEIMACARECTSHPRLQKEEISTEIGDAILEYIIGETFC